MRWWGKFLGGLGLLAIASTGLGSAQAQQSNQLFWQCLTPTSQNPSGGYCPVSTTYPLPSTATISQTSPGVSNGVSIDPTSATTAGVTPGSALGATSLVVKATPGNLWSGYAINRTATAGFLVVYNAVAAPAPGALTAGLVLGCVPLPANGAGSINNKPGPQQIYSVGITLLATSASNCGTYTTGTITADIFGDAS